MGWQARRGREAAALLLPREQKGAQVQRLATALVLTLGGGASASSKGVDGRARTDDVRGRSQGARPLARLTLRCLREKQDGAERRVPQLNQKKCGREREKREETASHRD
jgi:hypothetical protein